jgi:ArsR family transcriptional regulator, virulence genes transcriptional regulator
VCLIGLTHLRWPLGLDNFDPWPSDKRNHNMNDLARKSNVTRLRPPPEEMARHAEQAAQFLKLMANPHRLMILCHLLDTEMSVSELNTHLPLSQSALSQHLAVLRNSGLVTTRREQQTIFYSLASGKVHAVMEVLYEQFCRPDV